MSSSKEDERLGDSVLSWKSTIIAEWLIALGAPALLVGLMYLSRFLRPRDEREKIERDQREGLLAENPDNFMLRLSPLGRSFHYWLVLSATLSLTFVFADLFIWITPYLRQGYALTLQKLGLQTTQLLLSAVIMGLGGLAYVFKQKDQRMYGIIEIIFAGAASVITSRQVRLGGDLASPIASLVGCVYIVSRGLNNYSDGLRKLNKKEGPKESEASPSSLAASANP